MIPQTVYTSISKWISFPLLRLEPRVKTKKDQMRRDGLKMFIVEYSSFKCTYSIGRAVEAVLILKRNETHVEACVTEQ